MTQTELLDGLDAETKRLLDVLRAEFSAQDAAALQRHPGPGQWSALECFAHLNAYFNLYLPKIELGLHKSKARAWAPADEIRYTLRGKNLLRRTNPDRGYKSAKKFNFHGLNPEVHHLKTLIIQLERLLRLLQSARESNLNRIRIRKHKGLHANYTLGNLLEWLVRHSSKHIQQARV